MRSRQAGFTIIELMITLTVLAIILAAAVPTFRDFTRNNRVIAAQNDLVTAMSLARSEAIKRSADVILCPTDSGGTTCSSTLNWANGWLVRVASDANPLQVWSAPGGDLTAVSTIDQLRYQPIGTVATGGAITIAYSGCTGPKAHRVTVLVVGTPQAEMRTC